MDDFDFEEQLRMEKEARMGIDLLKRGEPVKRTRVEEDGCVMEFDEEKKAWFPKIDEDFIAKYQMSYGHPSGQANTTPAIPAFICSLGPPPPEPKPSREYKDSESVEFWREYNDQCRRSYVDRKAAQRSNQGEIDSEDEMDQRKEDTVNDDYDYTAYYTYYHKQRALELAAYNDLHRPPVDPKTEVAHAATPSEVASVAGDVSKTADTTTATNKSEQKLNKTGDDVTDAFWTGYFKDNAGKHIEEEKKKEINVEVEEKKVKEAARKRKEDEAGWFDSTTQQCTSVYIKGLPDDIDEDELRTVMSRCGLIACDPRTKKIKVKLYRDKDGKTKGDGLCTYIKPESVKLAEQIVDGSEIRGSTLSVESAKFEMKGNFDPLKKKKKLANKEKNKHKKHEAKLFDWKLESDEVVPVKLKHERTVIIKNAFDPSSFEGNMLLINKVRDNLRTECQKYGDVKKVIIFDRHTDGVVSVLFKTSDEADKCVEAMHNRYLSRQLLQVCIWNGTAKYDIEETASEREERIQQWNRYLDDGDCGKHNAGTADDAKTPDVSACQDGSKPRKSGEQPHEGDPASAPELQEQQQGEEVSPTQVPITVGEVCSTRGAGDEGMMCEEAASNVESKKDFRGDTDAAEVVKVEIDAQLLDEDKENVGVVTDPAVPRPSFDDNHDSDKEN